MKKILTKKLIQKTLKNKGVVGYEDLGDEHKAEEIVLKHFDAEIDDGWQGHYDMHFYSETTADGYEIWIATDDETSPSITEDIYYYDDDWLEKLEDSITRGDRIYMDQHSKEEYGFEDAIQKCYETYYEEKEEEIINELIEKGYEKETRKEKTSIT